MALLHEEIKKTPDQEVTINMVLTRGVEEIFPAYGLVELMEERPITIYLGIDPTARDLHIGHIVPLKKLRQFQLLGNVNINLLFGSFTAMLGDPSGKDSTRIALTPVQVMENVAGYKEQAGLILDLSSEVPRPVQVVYNGDWLSELTVSQFLELASLMTVDEMITWTTFAERLASSDKKLALSELLYPLLQGYDSVALSTDVELGGKDQRMNMLVGTKFLHYFAKRQKWGITTKLIVDSDGKKMGKTTGTAVNITEWPEVIFEALMTWPDSTIALGLELLTLVPMEIVKQVDEAMKMNPVETKQAFAWRVVRDLHGEEAANYAEEEFGLVLRKKNLPRRIQTTELDTVITLAEALVKTGLSPDSENAKALITQGAVRVNNSVWRKYKNLQSGEYIIKIGKKTIKNIRKVVIHS